MAAAVAPSAAGAVHKAAPAPVTLTPAKGEMGFTVQHQPGAIAMQVDFTVAPAPAAAALSLTSSDAAVFHTWRYAPESGCIRLYIVQRVGTFAEGSTAGSIKGLQRGTTVSAVTQALVSLSSTLTQSGAAAQGTIEQGGGSSSGGSGNSGSSGSSNTTTETTRNPDGSTTTTTTNKVTGTVTETTRAPDGSTTTVETKKDGSTTETVKTADGVTGTVSTNRNGDITEVSASVSSSAAKGAAETGAAVTLPVEVPMAGALSDAPAVEVSLPHSAGTVKVEIPVETVTPGTVAVILHADGTKEIVKTSLPTKDGVVLTLDGLATVKIVDNSGEFSDTDGHWAEASIDFTTARELFAGTSETTFTPDGTMTRAMVMTVLARFDGEDTTGGAVWYEKGMAWAVENGISDGSSPAVSVPREQFATMLWRYAGSPVVEDALSGFPDHTDVSDYATQAMNWAVHTGVISGNDAGMLMPQGFATRAQVATMLMRFVEDLSK